jgi:hypothetical protein
MIKETQLATPVSFVKSHPRQFRMDDRNTATTTPSSVAKQSETTTARREA